MISQPERAFPRMESNSPGKQLSRFFCANEYQIKNLFNDNNEDADQSQLFQAS